MENGYINAKTLGKSVAFYILIPEHYSRHPVYFGFCILYMYCHGSWLNADKYGNYKGNKHNWINGQVTKLTALDTSLYLLLANATRFLNFYGKMLLASGFQASENIHLNSRFQNNQNLTIHNMHK